MSLHTPIWMAKIKVKAPKCWKEYVETDHSRIANENEKWYRYSGQQFDNFSKNCTLGIYTKEMKTYVHTKTFVWIFTASLCVIAQN
jgi:hypothetical protein